MKNLDRQSDDGTETTAYQKRKVITYGTFDLFHHGHYNLLKRAKELGDYLIVGVTTDAYDYYRGKLNVQDSLMVRIDNVRETGFADEIIIEEYEGQKIDDIIKFSVDVFTVGSDWTGKFDYLKEYCEVTYIERTRDISSTQKRTEKNKTLRLGIIGTGRIANRFLVESKYVSGVDIVGVYNPNSDSAKKFVRERELSFSTADLSVFFDQVDAVYVASPHETHFFYAYEALTRQKHVLCEKPAVLSIEHLHILQSCAQKNLCVFMEAMKTAYAPAFQRLCVMAKSGVIGQIKSVDACFTKLVEGNMRELKPEQAGGSVTELCSYVLLPIGRLLGYDYDEIQFISCCKKQGVDLYTQGMLKYKQAIATFRVGLGVKSEGSLIVSATRGYIYVPAPWWQTSYFEIRFEDHNLTQKFFSPFPGDGLRFEIGEFVKRIRGSATGITKSNLDSLFSVGLIDIYRAGEYTKYIEY